MLLGFGGDGIQSAVVPEICLLLTPRKSTIRPWLFRGEQTQTAVELMPKVEVGVVPLMAKTYFLELLLDFDQLLEVQVLKFNLLLCHCWCLMCR